MLNNWRFFHLWCFWCLFFCLGICRANNAVSTENNTCTGIWARKAILLFDVKTNAVQDISSFNDKSLIHSNKNGLTLITDHTSVQLEGVIGNPPVTEVLWSPDSTGFIINESDGGQVGTWLTHLFLKSNSEKLSILDLADLVKPGVIGFAQCDTEEIINMGVAAWSDNSKEILLIAEVPPHSSCKNMGSIIGFRISLNDRQIIEKISEDKLLQKWSDVMGCRFSSIISQYKNKK